MDSGADYIAFPEAPYVFQGEGFFPISAAQERADLQSSSFLYVAKFSKGRGQTQSPRTRDGDDEVATYGPGKDQICKLDTKSEVNVLWSLFSVTSGVRTTIELTHDTFWGTRIVSVDGIQVLRKRKFLDGGSVHQLDLQQFTPLKFSVRIFDGSVFQYFLLVDDVPVERFLQSHAENALGPTKCMTYSKNAYVDKSSLCREQRRRRSQCERAERTQHTSVDAPRRWSLFNKKATQDYAPLLSDRNSITFA